MSNTTINVTIAFKTSGAPYIAKFSMSKQEAQRLAQDFTRAVQNEIASGVYEAETNAPVVLAVRFSDVLYIG